MTIQLSKRLQAIASNIASGILFADIGSDHAYLPCYVCLRDEQTRAVAGEVAPGPFKRAQQTVINIGLTDRIDVRLGDGLHILQSSDHIHTIVIAGMGGSLISDILYDGQHLLHHVDTLLLQPNNNERRVRETLLQLQYTLTNEWLIEEKGIIYEIMMAKNRAKHELQSPYEMTDDATKTKQLMFGPYLMAEKSELFRKKWYREAEKLTKIIKNMQKSSHKTVHHKIREFAMKKSWIEEVLL